MLYPRQLSCFVFLVCLHAAVADTPAPTIAWSGTAGDWTDAGKWSGGARPGASEAVTVANGGSILIADDNDTIGSLAIDNTSGVTVGPSGRLTIRGAGENGGTLTLGAKAAGMLSVRGGQVVVIGSVTSGSEPESISKVLVTDKGSLTARAFATPGGSTIVRIGPGAVVATDGQVNRFGELADSHVDFLLAAGTLRTAGRDQWGGAVTWKMTGGAYENSGGIFLGSSPKSQFQGDASGAVLIQCNGDFQLASGVGSNAVVTVSGGTFRAEKGFEIATAKGANGSFRLAGGELVTDTVTLGGADNELAELQLIGADAKATVRTVNCRGSVGLGFVTDLNTVAPLEVPVYLDLRSAGKAQLTVDLRLRVKEGMLTLIKTPRLNGKFTHVQISANGKPMTEVTTDKLAPGSYSMDYRPDGLRLNYRLPPR